jgi:hypothetical protein
MNQRLYSQLTKDIADKDNGDPQDCSTCLTQLLLLIFLTFLPPDFLLDIYPRGIETDS